MAKLICLLDEEVLSAKLGEKVIAIGVKAGASFEIRPLSFFETPNGRLDFDLKHCSEEAAMKLASKDPARWRII